MADPSTPAGTSSEADGGPDRALTTGAPRWVKVSGILTLVLVVLVVLMMLLGGGGHGPGRHMSGGHTAPSGVTEHAGGDVPPPGVPGHGVSRP